MKSYLPHASILTVLILLAMPRFNGAARVHRAPQTPPQYIELQFLELPPQPELPQEVPPVKLPLDCQNITPDVQTHDEEDDFGRLKPESKYVPDPSSEMKKLIEEKHKKNPLSYRPKGYDDPRIDMILADSFKLRNCRICYATLEYRVKQGRPSDPRNDTIKVGLAPFYLSRPYGKVFFMGTIWNGQWNKNAEVKTITLDAALKDLNIYLATDNPRPTYLDVLGEDDTDFDYITLRVWYY
jgi:hypothetical protein